VLTIRSRKIPRAGAFVGSVRVSKALAGVTPQARFLQDEAGVGLGFLAEASRDSLGACANQGSLGIEVAGSSVLAITWPTGKNGQLTGHTPAMEPTYLIMAHPTVQTWRRRTLIDLMLAAVSLETRGITEAGVPKDPVDTGTPVQAGPKLAVVYVLPANLALEPGSIAGAPESSREVGAYPPVLANPYGAFVHVFLTVHPGITSSVAVAFVGTPF